MHGDDLQGTSNSLIDSNIIFNAVPVVNQSCGLWESSGSGSAGGTEQDNKISRLTSVS
jgi:hypothetical protein